MKKTSFAITAILLYQVAPLIGNLSLLWHWKMLTIIVVATILWLSQPALNPKEASERRAKDRNTMWLILAMAGLATVVPELEWAYFSDDHQGSNGWNAIGLAMMVGGTAYRWSAIQTLGKHFTATVHTGETQSLIMHGPYRTLRHPSYFGAFTAIVGCAVLLQAWAGVLVAMIAMVYAYRQRILAEESALALHFGAAYQDYQSRSWRMFPGIW